MVTVDSVGSKSRSNFCRSACRLRASVEGGPTGFSGPRAAARACSDSICRDLISWLSAAVAGSAPPTLSRRELTTLTCSALKS